MNKTAQHHADHYLIFVCYYSFYLIGFIAWIFFRDYYQRKFQYSAIDLVYLALMALPLLFPSIVWFGKKRLPFFRNKSTAEVGVFVAATWYLVFSVIYYNTQEHLFDPFVQIPFPQLKRQVAKVSNGTFRILALGGSTTQGFGLPKEKSYPAILDALLRDRFPARAISVFNAGMQWYTSKHSLVNFITYYQDWKPDVAVVMHGVNDLFRSCVPIDFAVAPYNDEWSHFYGPAIRGAKPLTLEEFMFKPMLRPWISRFGSRAVDYPVEFYVSKSTFELNLRKLIKAIKGGGAMPLLVTEPFLYKEKMTTEEIKRLWMGQVLCNAQNVFIFEEYPSFISLSRAMKAFSEVVKAVAASEGVIVIDAEASMEKLLTNFVDDVHHTELGAKNLARLIATEIVKQNIVE